jgi:sulfur carrier protein ThiS
METKEQLKEERDKIVKGLEETYRKLVEFKKAKNSPFVVVRNGKIVEIDPHEVPPTISYKRGQG